MTIHPETRVGHVHLKVADLDRAIAFYSGILGFQVTQRYGKQAAFLAAGGYHHHIGLNTWESLGASPPPPGHTGLYHSAFLFPDRKALAQVLKRLVEAGYPLPGPLITACPRRCIWMIPTATGSSFTATGPRPTGRARRMEPLR
jgi:catechol 2,3-dioxygenase